MLVGEAGADVVQTDAATLPAYLLVFLSSEEHTGQFPPIDGGSVLTGLSGADALCQRLGDNAPATKGRQWVAWLSTDLIGGDARTRLARTVSGDLVHEYRLVDGVTVVFSKGFNFDVVLEGGAASLPSKPISVTENGVVLQEQSVWTGTVNDGKANPPYVCGNWNVDRPDASIGALGTSTSVDLWSFASSAVECTALLHLYCFEHRP